MPALRHNRILIPFLTNHTRERDSFQHRILVLFPIFLSVLRLTAIRSSNVLPAQILLPFRSDFPVLVQLPTLLVVLSGMQKLAAISKAAT